jgi:hypothetical protein
MSVLDDLKPFANRFATTWCYGWKFGCRLIEGEAVSIVRVPKSKCFEVRTSAWALDLECAELERSEEVYRLTEEDLLSSQRPMGVQDDSPGEYVNGVQWHTPSLFTENGSDLNSVPDRILSQAVELYFDVKDYLSDYFTEDDPYEFVLPVGLHPVVHSVLDRLCREEAQKLREKSAEHERRIRIFDLILETEPPVTVNSGQLVEGLRDLKSFGKGVAVLNGMPQDGSPGSHIRASGFHQQIKAKKESGHLVVLAKGIFGGVMQEGILVVAIFDVSRADSESLLKLCSRQFGLFIADDLLPQFISG